jgi:hypothetical protein
MQDFDSLYAHVTSALKTKGLPAAVRVITRIYEESDPAKPWASFNMGSAVTAIHIARWTLGHDKTGKKIYEPKTVTDPRFKKLVASHLPPGETPERLVMAIAVEHIPALVQILQAESSKVETGAMAM